MTKELETITARLLALHPENFVPKGTEIDLTAWQHDYKNTLDAIKVYALSLVEQSLPEEISVTTYDLTLPPAEQEEIRRLNRKAICPNAVRSQVLENALRIVGGRELDTIMNKPDWQTPLDALSLTPPPPSKGSTKKQDERVRA